MDSRIVILRIKFFFRLAVARLKLHLKDGEKYDTQELADNNHLSPPTFLCTSHNAVAASSHKDSGPRSHCRGPS